MSSPRGLRRDHVPTNFFGHLSTNAAIVFIPNSELTCARRHGNDQAEREESLVCDGNPKVGEEIDGCKKKENLTGPGILPRWVVLGSQLRNFTPKRDITHIRDDVHMTSTLRGEGG